MGRAGHGTGYRWLALSCNLHPSWWTRSCGMPATGACKSLHSAPAIAGIARRAGAAAPGVPMPFANSRANTPGSNLARSWLLPNRRARREGRNMPAPAAGMPASPIQRRCQRLCSLPRRLRKALPAGLETASVAFEVAPLPWNSPHHHCQAPSAGENPQTGEPPAPLAPACSPVLESRRPSWCATWYGGQTLPPLPQPTLAQWTRKGSQIPGPVPFLCSKAQERIERRPCPPGGLCMYLLWRSRGRGSAHRHPVLLRPHSRHGGLRGGT